MIKPKHFAERRCWRCPHGRMKAQSRPIAPLRCRYFVSGPRSCGFLGKDPPAKATVLKGKAAERTVQTWPDRWQDPSFFHGEKASVARAALRMQQGVCAPRPAGAAAAAASAPALPGAGFSEAGGAGSSRRESGGTPARPRAGAPAAEAGGWRRNGERGCASSAM